jgi:photosystem II stability/assembly factor-like uncharacterized protein
MTGDDNVFVSKDRGLTWTSHEIDGSGKQVEVAPARPSTIFAACLRGGGLYKSADSGTTWNTSHAGIAFCDIASLALAPSGPETIYVDIDGASSFMASNDGGATWEKRSYPLFGCSGTFCDMLVDARDPQLVLALESG